MDGITLIHLEPEGSSKLKKLTVGAHLITGKGLANDICNS